MAGGGGGEGKPLRKIGRPSQPVEWGARWPRNLVGDAPRRGHHDPRWQPPLNTSGVGGVREKMEGERRGEEEKLEPSPEKIGRCQVQEVCVYV